MKHTFRVNKYLLLLWLILVIDSDFWYLAPDKYSTFIDILSLFIKFYFIVLVSLINNKHCKYSNRKIFIFAIFIAVTSSIMANKNYHQSLFLGLMPQREWIVSLLMYFPLSKLIKAKKISTDAIINTVDSYNYVLIFLSLIQYTIGTRFIFLNILTSSRYGSMRLHLDTTLLLISYFWYLGKFINGKKLSAAKYLYLFLILFIQIFVVKSRMAIVMVGAASLLALFKMKFTGKKMFVLSALVIFVAIFFSTTFGNSMLDSLIGSTSQDAGTQIRDVGRLFYLRQTFSSWQNTFFGCGYVNLKWPESVLKSRYMEKIYWVDNGMIGLMFYYGLSIALWVAYSSFMIIKNTWKQDSIGIAFFIICGLVGFLTYFPYNYATNISFAIVCAISEKNQRVDYGR